MIFDIEADRVRLIWMMWSKRHPIWRIASKLGLSIEDVKLVINNPQDD